MNRLGVILVVANETSTSDRLLEIVRGPAEEGAEVVVVAPSLNGRLGYWMSDDAGARLAAGGRLAQCLEQLAAANISAYGYIGDAEPLQAIADALCLHSVSRIIISTHAPAVSSWLTRDLVQRARARFAIPVDDATAPVRELAVAA